MTKVRRLSDGKVFSSPRGVALHTGKAIAKSVYYCCRGYIASVGGEQYEWAYDIPDDHGKVPQGEGYWRRRGKWTTGHAKWNDRNVIREILFRRSIVFKLWLQEVRDPEKWRSASELCDELSKVYERTKDEVPQFPWIFNATTISRHLNAYNLAYEKMFGIHKHYLSVPGFKGWIFKFVKEDADAEFDILTDEILRNTRSGARPVIQVNTGDYFESINQAAIATEIPYWRIYHCCEGDIPYFEFLGVKWEFRYAKDNQ